MTASASGQLPPALLPIRAMRPSSTRMSLGPAAGHAGPGNDHRVVDEQPLDLPRVDRRLRAGGAGRLCARRAGDREHRNERNGEARDRSHGCAPRQYGKTDLSLQRFAGYSAGWLRAHRAEPHTRRSVMTESTPIVAFDQHAASVMAAVLLPGDRMPALHPLPPDLPSIHRFLARVGRRAYGAVTRRARAASTCSGHYRRRGSPASHCAGPDPPTRRQSGQDGSPRRRAACGALSRRGVDADPYSDRARRSGARSAALPRRHLHGSAARQASAVEILAAAWASLPGRPGVVETLLRMARGAALAAAGARADLHVVSTCDRRYRRAAPRGRCRSSGRAHGRSRCASRRAAALLPRHR